MNSDFASCTLTIGFWKPQIGVWQLLWGEDSQARGQGRWTFPTEHHPTAAGQKRTEGMRMVTQIRHNSGVARQACSYGQVQADTREGQGGDGTWPGTSIAATWDGQGQQLDPRWWCTMPALALSTANKPWVLGRGCGTCQCPQGLESSFLSSSTMELAAPDLHIQWMEKITSTYLF